MNIFTIGEPFTRHHLNIDGCDHLVPIITATGLDVVVALSNISNDESFAFSELPIEFAVLESDAAPFIIMKFGSAFYQQFALNVEKMPKIERDIWLNSSDKNLLQLFLVDADTGILKAYRSYAPKSFNRIKASCKEQARYDVNSIDEYIRYVEDQVSVTQMFEFAQLHEIIPKPKISI